jgi:hypothetical protein
MAETIKTITDTGQFEEIFKKFFANREVYLKTKSGDLFIQFLGFTEGTVMFRIPRVKNVPDTIVVFTRLSENTIYASLKFLENTENDFIFLPIKFQIISEKMKEERTDLAATGGKNVLYINNIISEQMIQGALDSNEKKVGIMKDKIAHDLKGKFDHVRVVFINETRIDVRMKRFMESWNPIIIKDLSDQSDLANKEKSFYINEIYSKDYKLSSHKELISEVSVPIIYKSMVPYGYIQVNNAKPMNETHLTVVKRLAVMINEYVLKERLFVPAPEKFIVNDISKKGLGVVFRERRLLRYYMKDSRLIFDLTLPDSNKVTMRVIVRNTIFNESGIIKVGLEILDIDAISEANYDEFLETMKQ